MEVVDLYAMFLHDFFRNLVVFNLIPGKAAAFPSGTLVVDAQISLAPVFFNRWTSSSKFFSYRAGGTDCVPFTLSRFPTLFTSGLR